MDFIARCLFAPFLLSLAPFSSYFSSPFPRLRTPFFVFFSCIPAGLESFAQLSLTSLSSTPLHYEVQLKITARQIIFILLELLKCIKIYFAINLVAC